MKKPINDVSIIFICLRDYYLFFDRFYDSCEKLFLRGVNKKYFVITDHGSEKFDQERVTHCLVKTPKRENKRGKRVVDVRRIKLNKFSYIDNFWTQISNSDYIFYFDADSVIKKSIRLEDIIDESKGLVGVVHGFGNVRRGSGKKGCRFESNPESEAYVDPDKHDVSTYYQSCLWGGAPNDVRAMLDDVSLWISKDIEAGHKNKNHICDEIYVNKYFALNKDNLKELDGRYASPSEGIAYRKGREYDGRKDIIVSHECCAQTRTFKKFMHKKNSQEKSISFHFNGQTFNKYSKEELSKVYETLESNAKNNNKLKECEIFTFDNHSTNPMFTNCCKQLGLPFINLGEEKYFNYIKNKYPMEELPRKHLLYRAWKDFCPVMKTLTLHHYLKNNPSKKYLFFFDQSDVLLVDNPEKKLEVFKDRGCGILYNAESKCMYFAMRIRRSAHYAGVKKYFANYTDVKNFEEEVYSDCHVSNEVPLRFLNTGGFICERDFYIDLLDKYYDFVVEFMSTNEQTIFHHLHFMYYPKIQVDHKCEIFQCMGPKKVEFNL